MERLELSRDDKIFLGVCGGFGEYSGIDATIWRLGLVILTLPFPFLILIYFIFALVMVPTK